jgi:hypothetical protein
MVRNAGVCYRSIADHSRALQFLNLTARLYPDSVPIQSIDISIGM